MDIVLLVSCHVIDSSCGGMDVVYDQYTELNNGFDGLEIMTI